MKEKEFYDAVWRVDRGDEYYKTTKFHEHISSGSREHLKRKKFLNVFLLRNFEAKNRFFQVFVASTDPFLEILVSTDSI